VTSVKMKAAERQSTARKAAKAGTEAKAKTKAAPKGRKAKVRYAAAAPASPEAHPKLGYKWVCSVCEAKFYDLGKEDAICPRCDADQRKQPWEKAAPKPPKPKPRKKPAIQPMARYLDDEEPAAAKSSDDGDEAAELDIASLEEGGGFTEPDFKDDD
jgi:hypothetical protein